MQKQYCSSKSLFIIYYLYYLIYRKKWVSSRYHQDFDGNDFLIEKFREFVDKQIAKDHSQAASNLINAISLAVRKKKKEKRKALEIQIKK